MARLVCQEFTKFLSILSDVGMVVQDSAVPADKQNIIIRRLGERVEVIGCSPTINSKVVCPSDVLYCDDEGSEDFLLQLKARDFITALSSYKSLQTTLVTQLTLELNAKNRIVCTVFEQDKEVGDNNLDTSLGDTAKKSVWYFDNIPLQASVTRSLEQEFPEETITVMGENFMKYINEAIPLLTGMPVGTYSKIYFAEDWVYLMHQAFISYIHNELDKTIFSGIAIELKSAQYLAKILKSGFGLQMEVGRKNNYLFLRACDYEVSLTCSTSLPDYKMYLSVLESRENGFEANRLYLRDVLKRLNITDEIVKVSFNRDDSTLTLSNTKCTQLINLSCITGFDNYPTFNFQMKADLLNKAILYDTADDGTTREFVRFYLNEFKQNHIIVLTDEMGLWSSVIRIKMDRVMQ